MGAASFCSWAVGVGVLCAFGLLNEIAAVGTEPLQTHLSIATSNSQPRYISDSASQRNPNQISSTNGSSHDTKKRKDINYDTWVAPEFIRKYYPYYHAGYDEEERPIWVAEFGKFKLRNILDRGEDAKIDFENYIEQASYRMHKSIRDRNLELGGRDEENANGPVTHVVFLIDFDGLEIQRLAHLPTMTYVLSIARGHKHQVNEIAGATIIINVNYAAEFFLSAVRPLFGRTFENTEIYGTNKAKWIPKIQRMFPHNAIPEWYGGSKDFKPVRVYG